MIDQQNGHDPATAPTDDLAEVIRLTDAQRAHLAPYLAALGQAQQNLNAVFAAVLVGRGVDLSRYEARLSPDGAAAIVRVTQPAPAGGEGE